MLLRLLKKFPEFRKFNLLILYMLTLLFWVKCSHKYYLYPTLAYDIENRSFKKLEKIYRHVKKQENTNLESFIEKIGLIAPTQELLASKISTKTVLQCFINEKGQIETIFIVKHAQLHDFDLSYDMLAVHAFLQSKFKTLKANKSTYFIIVSYPIYKGQPLNPIVNGNPTDTLVAKGKFVIDR